MDDVVAVALVLPNGEHRYIVTWGRVQRYVDPEPLETLVLRWAGKFSGCQDAVSAYVCATLREAESGPRFYEALIEFAAKKARIDDYDEWVEQMAERMENGRELYYLGDPSRAGRYESPGGDG